MLLLLELVHWYGKSWKKNKKCIKKKAKSNIDLAFFYLFEQSQFTFETKISLNKS